MKIPLTLLITSFAVALIVMNPDSATWSKLLGTAMVSFMWGAEFGRSKWANEALGRKE